MSVNLNKQEQSLVNNNFADIMLNRRSVRMYDKNVKITHQEMLDILRETVTAPSAVNLQPWRFVVVESDEGKNKLKPLIRFNQQQNETSAAMVLFFGDLRPQEYANKIYDQAVAEGKMPQEVHDQQLSSIIPYYDALTKEEMTNVVKIDTSIAAMQFMNVARAHGYDTNPMTGFEADQLAEAFDLDPERFVPVMMISIGKAEVAGYESVRLDPENITTFA
ncbi:MAG: nitroreductase family protein [Carnobacterium sp.]|uniref:Nitroreductase family protein n=1 Tax=Enterococcus viikkiensis TaxID=930854 RepID=A0ABU3FTT0_9ENTE|nr:nitroreductase family protein [Enterococcus viikkiensis]MDT2829063.1 nitroreductase family protein [Enterococcus viikkiensis]